MDRMQNSTPIIPTERLDSFTGSYITTALWSSTDDNGEPIDRSYGRDDIADETLAKMIADCDAFQKQNEALLEEGTSERAGHDFWLTRNRHGAGFWDGDWPVNGDKLTEAAHAFGECHLYVGDDSKLYI